MVNLAALWNYQAAEAELSALEKSLKNTDTRKKLVRQQQLYGQFKQRLQQLEQGAFLAQSKLSEVNAQLETLRKQMEQKAEEVAEIQDDDAEDLFLEDVRESVRETEEIRSAIEMNKRKVVEVLHSLEKAEVEIKETLLKMSQVKKNFDALKAAHEAELAAGKGDVEKLRANVAKAAQGIDESLMNEYKRIKQQRTNPIAYFKNGRCQGCNMELPSSVAQSIKAGDKIVTCENCSRILYLVEEEE